MTNETEGTDVFISYSSEDRELARKLMVILEDEGVSVWWDRDLRPGETYDDKIEAALHGAKCVIVLWSRTSIESDWVKSESTEGREHQALVPAFLEKVTAPLEFRRIHTADLIGWQGEPDRPGLRNLINAVKQILERKAGTIPRPGERHTQQREPAPTPERDPAPTRERQTTAGTGGNNQLLLIGGIAIVAVVAVVAAIFFLVSSGGGTPSLEEIVADINPLEKFAAPVPIPPPPPRPLPDISQFPLVVSAFAPDGVKAEIFVSTEKSGTGTDGWIVEVAEAFNAADIRLADGRPARVSIRKIASGVGYEFIAGGEPPDGYSPSNHLWIEMARESVPMTAIDEQLVPNVGGLVLRSEKASDLEATYGTLTASVLVDAVIAGDLIMGYTDPFASSTGLNFLITVLWELGGGDEGRMLSSDVEQRFQDFQQNVPFVALTTLQIRDSVVRGGTLDAFVMEHQTFVQTDVLSEGFEFIPFGIAHDNPLYAVGDVSPEKLEVLELFAEYTERPEFRDLANVYGFNPAAYEPLVDIPSGQTLIDAQQLWKVNKDAGRPVTAVFVTDVSGSMQGSRIAAVRAALETGINEIREDNYIGMVTFSDQVTQVLEVRQFDLDQKRRFAGAANEMSVGGGTAMYDGIAVGLSLLLEAEREIPGTKLMLIVLTDGRTDRGHTTFDDMSDIIADLGIPVYTVGFEADIDELARLSALVEAASINATEEDVEFRIARLFNAEL